MKKTPLYETHVALGAKIVDFAGWALPVQYSGIIKEHYSVRNKAGLFDVSHMGEIIVRGRKAKEYIQKLVTNDIAAAEDFQVVYSPMCYPDGGVVDDLLIYKISEEEYILVVNAANIEKDVAWLNENTQEGAEILNVSDDYAQLALQGPLSEKILQRLATITFDKLGYFRFIPEVNLDGAKALVSRTGYTGEDGFEIYVHPEDAVKIWMKLLDAGKDEGLVPAGLGARDILRFEAALPLYGHELSPDISPLEAGLDRFVKLYKDDFIGKKALIGQKESGVKRRLTGFEMLDKGIPRNNYDVMRNGEKIGVVTSGGFSPSLEKNLGMALVKSEYSEPGMEIEVVVREKYLKARVVKLPFYRRRSKGQQS